MQFLSGFKFHPLDRPLTTYDKFEFVDEYISEEKEVLRVKADFEPIDKSSIKTIAEGKVGWLGRGTSGVATQRNGCTGVVFSPPHPYFLPPNSLHLTSTPPCSCSIHYFSSTLNSCILSVDGDNFCKKQSYA